MKRYRILKADIVKIGNPSLGGVVIEEKDFKSADDIKRFLNEGAIEEVKATPKAAPSGG